MKILTMVDEEILEVEVEEPFEEEGVKTLTNGSTTKTQPMP